MNGWPGGRGKVCDYVTGGREPPEMSPSRCLLVETGGWLELQHGSQLELSLWSPCIFSPYGQAWASLAWQLGSKSRYLRKALWRLNSILWSHCKSLRVLPLGLETCLDSTVGNTVSTSQRERASSLPYKEGMQNGQSDDDHLWRIWGVTFFFFLILAVWSCMWDLSSLTRDGTCTTCLGSSES